MKVLTLVFMLFSPFNIGFSQERIEFSQLIVTVNGEEIGPIDDQFNRLRMNTGVVTHNGIAFTGIGYEENEGDNVAYNEIMTFKDGIREGVNKGWYSNGNVQFEQEYSEGNLQGTRFVWFEDKHQKIIGKYVNGKRHGEYKRWCNYNFEEYNLVESINYYDDRPHGRYQTWYCNGNIEERRTYVYGNRDGVSIEYYFNGQIKERTNYLGGEKHGKSEGWFEDGEVSWIREYRNGERVN